MGAGQLEIGDVGASDKQHEARRAEQYVQNRAYFTRARRGERQERRDEPAAWVFLVESGGQNAHVGSRRLERDARLQPGIGV